jgi:hypothetical protein
LQILTTPTTTLTGTVADAANYDTVAQMLHGECAREELGFKFSADLCDGLQKCYPLWEERYGGHSGAKHGGGGGGGEGGEGGEGGGGGEGGEDGKGSKKRRRKRARKASLARWPDWRGIATPAQIEAKESEEQQGNNYDGRNHIFEK